jgi:hypothetical protein
MKSARFDPAPLEGQPFAIRDLQVAVGWAESIPNVRLQIMLDHPDIAEVIEIYPPSSASPRWLIWNTFAGCLRVDDLAKAKFGLPYSTVDTALRFIELELKLSAYRGL